MNKSFKQKIKYVFIVIVAVVLIYIFVQVASLLFLLTLRYTSDNNEKDNRDVSKQEQMLKILLDWGRLAPIPADAKDFTIYTTGSSMSRQFHAHFLLNKVEMDKWISISPGLHYASKQELTNNVKKYIIFPPGGDAQRAIMIYNLYTHEVQIDVSQN
jgi:hypothetical protein